MKTNGDADLAMAAQVRHLVAAELAVADRSTGAARHDVAAFRAALAEPEAIEVTFSGGMTQTCWTVTRSDGCYSVVYMPRAGYFSLCVDSAFGPLDIGVHGEAVACFASV